MLLRNVESQLRTQTDMICGRKQHFLRLSFISRLSLLSTFREYYIMRILYFDSANPVNLFVYIFRESRKQF